MSSSPAIREADYRRGALASANEPRSVIATAQRSVPISACETSIQENRRITQTNPLYPTKTGHSS